MLHFYVTKNVTILILSAKKNKINHKNNYFNKTKPPFESQ